MARRALALTQDVTLFSDGSVVLERIANGAIPDLLVLDSQLLGVSGLEVCRIVRESHAASDLPIVMLTGQGDKQHVIEALQAGANDYVTKPYHVDELVARVATLVSSARLVSAQTARAREMTLAATIGGIVTDGRNIPEIARRVAEALATQLGTLGAEVWIQTPDGFAREGVSAPPRDQPVSAEVARRAGETNQTVVNKGTGPAPGSPPRHYGAVPLTVRDEVVGVLAVADGDRIDETLEAMATVAKLLALGLARTRAEEDRVVLLDRERNARAEAEAANRSKDEFLATVSHELRTPLNAITGWTSLLLSGNLDAARVQRAYETIDRNARAQAQLIEDLLDIGRITSGNLRIEESTFEVASVAEMALESCRLAADGRGVTVNARIDPASGELKGDATRIQQVIWNLLSNAIKFTPKGGSVTLTVEPVASAIVITIADTGQGIDAAFLPRVFERFRQADPSPTRARGGLGLGLSIVLHLVELHGGTIEARSEGLGKGATFVVSLPTQPRSSRDLATRAVVASDRLDRPREIEGLRVLVVDDEADTRDLLRTLLESCRMEVSTASSVAEAMVSFATRAPDLLLSDIAMPDEDGLSLIRRVRALSRDEGGRTPAAALSAYARLEDRTRALRAGFNAHVAKPVEPNELLAVLSSLASTR